MRIEKKKANSSKTTDSFEKAEKNYVNKTDKI